jgi:hypothetical protein
MIFSVTLLPKFSTNIFRDWLIKTVINTEINLSKEGYPLVKENNSLRNFAYIIDISKLDLSELSDNSTKFFNNSPLLLLEDGVPLKPHQLHNDLRQKSIGGFSHWGDTIYLSPTPNGKTLKDRNYSLIYPKVDFTANPLDLLKNSSIYYLIIFCLVTYFYNLNKPQFLLKEKKIYFCILAVFIVYTIGFTTILTTKGLSNWQAFSINNDSLGWAEPYTVKTTRPFVYPTFINLALASKGLTSSDIAWNQLPNGTAVYDDLEHPLLFVIRLQKTFYIACVLVAAWILSSYINPLLILTSFSWLFLNAYFPHEFDSIFAETLAHGCMFLVVALFVRTFYKPSYLNFITFAFVSSFLFHIRSSGIFVLTLYFFLLAFNFSFSNFTDSCKKVIPSFLVLLTTLLAPNFYRWVKTGFFSPAPMYSDARIAFALQVAKLDDIKDFKTKSEVAFLNEVLKRKNAVHKNWRSEHNISSELQLLSANLYDLAHPVANDMNLDNTARRKVFQNVSEKLIYKHFFHYLALVGESFNNALNVVGRLGGGNFLMFSLFYLFICFVSFNKVSLISLTLFTAHITHIVIISLFDVPQQRYVYASEFFVVLGIAFLMPSLIFRFQQFSLHLGSLLWKKRSEC